MTWSGSLAEGHTDTPSCVPARVWQKEISQIDTGNIFTSTMSTRQNKNFNPGLIRFWDIGSGIHANLWMSNQIMHYLLC